MLSWTDGNCFKFNLLSRALASAWNSCPILCEHSLKNRARTKNEPLRHCRCWAQAFCPASHWRNSQALWCWPHPARRSVSLIISEFSECRRSNSFICFSFDPSRYSRYSISECIWGLCWSVPHTVWYYCRFCLHFLDHPISGNANEVWWSFNIESKSGVWHLEQWEAMLTSLSAHGNIAMPHWNEDNWRKPQPMKNWKKLSSRDIPLRRYIIEFFNSIEPSLQEI